MLNHLILYTGADWPSGAPGEFPLAWQPIWPAALHNFFIIIIIIIIIFFYIVVVFVACRMY